VIDRFPNPVPTLLGNKIALRALTPDDVGEHYLSWINDSTVVQYTESRFRQHTIGDLEEYVTNSLEDSGAGIWAIWENSANRHIGNIKLGPVDWNHRFGDIGLIIGEMSAWGRGYATEVISLLCEYAFTELLLHKLTAGMYAENIGSRKSFERVGFKKEGVRRSQYLLNGVYTDLILLGCLRETYEPVKK